MSRRVNWKLTEKNTKELKRRIKNTASASAYLEAHPEPGYFVDNISKKTVKLSECKDSTLRRYVKLLDKYYYLVTSPTDKQFILDKKIEVENELESRSQTN